MAVLGITSHAGRLYCPEDPALDPRFHLQRALARLPRSAPVVLLIHGFRYHPALPGADPHRLLFATAPDTALRRKHRPWPRGLGFHPRSTRDGLCLTLAWEGAATDTSPLIPRIARFGRVYARAGGTAQRVARLLTWIHEIDPTRQVDVLAHSLGARVIMQALPELAHPVLGRVILMGAAEYESEVLAALRANRANPQAEFFNITARENDMFDFLFERFAPSRQAGDRALGAGLSVTRSNWLDIQIDHNETCARLATRGVALAPAMSPVTHWGFYMRKGAFRLYRRLIRDRDRWALRTLAHELRTVAPDPRWSHLRDLSRLTGTLGGRA